MIVWQGKGWLVPAIVFGCSLLANVLANSLTDSPDYWETHRWPFGMSLFVAGMICWFIGQHLESEKSRVLVDQETGEELHHSQKHTLFWIPVKWCGAMAMFGASVIIVVEMVTLAN